MLDLFIISKLCQHAKYDRIYSGRLKDIVLDLIREPQPREPRGKMVQFATILHLVIEGRPTTDYEAMRGLFQFLKVKHNLRKQLGDNSR